jgi:hypothetical protein
VGNGQVDFAHFHKRDDLDCAPTQQIGSNLQQGLGRVTQFCAFFLCLNCVAELRETRGYFDLGGRDKFCEFVFIIDAINRARPSNMP